MELSKIYVAKRQLVTAIRLFFDRQDAISIYSLASNAWEVIDELCSHNSIQSESLKTRKRIPTSKNLKIDYINSPYRNYFKHADRDTETTLSGFTECTPEPVLFLACEDYIRLNKASPVEVQVFQFWFIAMYPNKLSKVSSAKLTESINAAFPNIQSLRRVEQIAIGKSFLERVCKDPSVTLDPRTEVAE